MKNINQETFQEYLHNIIGKSYEQLDCWGIVKDFYKNIYDIDLPEFYTERPQNTKIVHEMITNERPLFNQVKTPKIGNVVLMKVLGVPVHLGIYIGESKILHTTKKTGCIIENESSFGKRRIEGYYCYGKN